LDPRRVLPLGVLLEIGAEAVERRRDARQVPGQAAAVPELHLEPAEESEVAAAVCEARHVDVLAADAEVVLQRVAIELRQKPGHMDAQLLAEIPADDVRPLANAVRLLAAFRGD